MKKLIVLTGPTAVGKTELSINLAKAVNGEIISADSIQVYKGMDIGSAKITVDEMQGINHYLIDILEPAEEFNIHLFKTLTLKAMDEIYAKDKIPIIVGGTGLYVDSLIYEIEYQDMEFDINYRNELMEKAETNEGLKELYEQAKTIDSKAMEKISSNDKKRIIRVLEIYKATGKTKTELEILSRQKEVEYNYKVFVVNMDREKLYNRIDKRVDIMI